MISLFTKERKQTLLKEIITFFKTERDFEIGVLAAEDILEFFTEAIGKDLYNKGINDAKISIKDCMGNLEVDLDLLIK